MNGERPSAGCLTVIGDLVEDVVVWAEAPARAGTDNAAVVHRTRGGSAANVAAFAAADVTARFIGRIGDDQLGAAMVAELEALGVEVLVQREGRTGTVVVIVDGSGERTMYPDRGSGTGLVDVPHAWLAGTDVLHVPAYGLATEPMAGTILAAVDLVRTWHAAVSVDVSAASLIDDLGVMTFRTLLDRIAPEVVFANADEASVLALDSMEPWGVIVVKDGPRPARLLARGHEEWRDVPAIPVDRVVDTTGAGDAFAAGYLAGWMRGCDPVTACAAGHRSAAMVLTSPGAGRGTG